MEDGERPWLKPHVHTPAARDPEPGTTRNRPLIYGEHKIVKIINNVSQNAIFQLYRMVLLVLNINLM